MKKQLLLVTSLTALTGIALMFTKNNSNFKMNVAEKTNYTLTFDANHRQLTTAGGNTARITDLYSGNEECLSIIDKSTIGVAISTQYYFKKVKSVDINIKSTDATWGYISVCLSRTEMFYDDEDDIKTEGLALSSAVADNTTFTFEFKETDYPETYADDYRVQIWFALQIPHDEVLGNYAYTEVSSISVTYYC